MGKKRKSQKKHKKPALKKGDPPTKEFLNRVSGGAYLSTRGGNSLLAPVFTSTRILREAIGLLEPQVISGNFRTGVTVMEDHWAHQLLRKPNQWQTYYFFQALVSDHLNFDGNFYGYLMWVGNQVQEIIPIHPHSISPFIDPGTGTLKYNHSRGVKDAREILHIYLMPDRTMIKGLSPIAACSQTFDVAQATMDHAEYYFKNRAKPAGVLETPMAFADPNRGREIAAQFDELYTQEGSFKTAILEENMQYKPLSISNRDSQYLESKDANERDIYSIFRIPPTLSGAGGSDIPFASAREFNRVYGLYVISPYASMLEQALTEKLGLEAEGLRVNYNMDSTFQRGDPQARSDYARSQFGIGAMNRNEIRQMEYRGPVDGGDQFYMEANFVRLDEEGRASNEDPVQRADLSVVPKRNQS